MKPVYQTKFGKPEGNCLAACLASVFEIDLDSIPSFGCDDYWFDRFTTWMVENYELQPLDIEIPPPGGWKPKGYYIVNGPSVNGDFWHSVVGYRGEIVHDPYPDKPALKEARTYTLFIKV